MRYLGLDIGDKRIGIAISDPIGIVATPLEVYNCIGPKKDFKYIKEIVEENNIEVVIIGLPRNMDGSEGERAQISREFAEKLSRRINSQIIMHDERLTTISAERMLIEADVSRQKRKKVIDKLAAQLILQNYLDLINR